MAEIKVKTEVAGRVCSIPTSVGISVDNGEDIMLVEAMKMEIPVKSTAAGKIKTKGAPFVPCK